MKKIIALICAVLLCTSLFLAMVPSASADTMTAAMFGTAAYAYAQASGFDWIFGSGSTSETSSSWIENQVNSWLDGRDLSQVIGEAALTAEVGKLIIPYQIAVAIADFINDLIDKNDITPDNIAELSEGELRGFPLSSMSRNYTIGSGPQTDGLEVVSSKAVPFTVESTWFSGGGIDVYYNRNRVARFTYPSYYSYLYGWYPYLENGRIYFMFSGNRSDGGDKTQNRVDFESYYEINVSPDDITGQIQATLDSDFSLPEFPDVGYQWEGTVDGAAPDTNLDQLIGIINQDVADNNLVVDGEVVNPVDPPVPPTPVPIDPDTPLQDVPWEGLNDIIGQTGEGIEDQIQSQTDSIVSSQDATTEAVESLTDTITSALDVPDEEELTDFKFDVRDLFPFCIPFDIYRLLSSFDAEPEAPHVQLPIVIDSINFRYTLDLDFSAWNPVAQAMRTAELIVYAIGLAWATGKVIKW